jgi:glycosyltransferase involved in cell wall biosynthesis
MDPTWAHPAECIDCPVAYTEYGRQELLRLVGPNPGCPEIRVLPHGVDTEIYRPLPNRLELRDKLSQGWLKPEDILMINVNLNQRRKDVYRSLEILAELHRQGHTQFKLLMHMPRRSPEATDLELAADQMGLRRGGAIPISGIVCPPRS